VVRGRLTIEGADLSKGKMTGPQLPFPQQANAQTRLTGNWWAPISSLFPTRRWLKAT